MSYIRPDKTITDLSQTKKEIERYNDKDNWPNMNL